MIEDEKIELNSLLEEESNPLEVKGISIIGDNLELKHRDPSEDEESGTAVTAPLLPQNNPGPSCEAKLQSALTNGFLSGTYRTAVTGFFGVSLNSIANLIGDICTNYEPPPAQTSLAGQHPKLYASLGIVLIFCRLSSLTLPLLSTSAELLRIVQENKVNFNKGYREGLSEFNPKAPSTGAVALGNSKVVGTVASQGTIQFLAFPFTFIGAQKIAKAKSIKEALTGIVFVGTGLAATALNSIHNFTSQLGLAEAQGKNFGLLCASHEGCTGEREQDFPSFPAGINCFVSSIGAVVFGFMFGFAARVRTHMRRTTSLENPDQGQDQAPALGNNSING